MIELNQRTPLKFAMAAAASTHHGHPTAYGVCECGHYQGALCRGWPSANLQRQGRVSVTGDTTASVSVHGHAFPEQVRAWVPASEGLPVRGSSRTRTRADVRCKREVAPASRIHSTGISKLTGNSRAA